MPIPRTGPPGAARLRLVALALALALAAPAARAQGPDPGAAATVAARAELARDAATFRRHVEVLAGPEMEGRLPGTVGMERAIEYVERHFAAAGLVAPFAKDGAGLRVEASLGPGGASAHDLACAAGEGSFRQPFELGVRFGVREGRLTVGKAGDLEQGVERDFVVTTFGEGGEVTAPMVFVGYAIDRGPREDGDFTSFPEGLRLDGKIALMLRFEPVDEAGESRWRKARWSPRAMLWLKLQAVAERGAVGAVIVNPPGVKDPRADSLLDMEYGPRERLAFPVLHLSRAAGERVVAAVDPERRGLMALRRKADEGAFAVQLEGTATLAARLEAARVFAENVVGVLPGRGALAEEVVLVGAHLDHLGTGDPRRSRDPEGIGQIHPGADDNASGVAGLLMLAARLGQEYRTAPAEAGLRSIVFAAFNAEESDAKGSTWYAGAPPLPLARHRLAVNLDMIGRIERDRLFVQGVGTAPGLEAFVLPLADACPLCVETRGGFSTSGDHSALARAGVPTLLLVNDLHDDYHTPRDTPDKIRATEAVLALEFAHDLVRAAAARSGSF